MACMDHVCTNPKCDWQSCDNVPRYEACPKCGSPVQSSCDEDFHDHAEDRAEEPEED